MRTPFHRTALFVVLSSLTAVFLAACSSTESVSERRRRTERDSAESTEVPLADDSFWEESGEAGLANGEAGGTESNGASTADDFDSLFGDEAAPAPAPAPDRRDAGRRAAGAATARAGGGDPADDLLRDLAEDAEIKRESARYYVRAGDEARERQRYEEARDAYRRALNLDPANSEAENKLHEVLLLLGDRRGEREIAGDDILARIEVEKQLQKSEIRRNVEEAEEAFSQGDLNRAHWAARAAADMSAALEDTDEEIRARAQALLEEIEKEQIRVAAERRNEIRNQAEEEQREELAREEERKRAQIQEFLAATHRNIRSKDYDKALQSSESILKIDPSNRIALYFRSLAHDQLLNQRIARVIAERSKAKEGEAIAQVDDFTPQEDFSFPSADKWNQVRQREKRAGSVLDLHEPEPVRRIRNQLESYVIQDLNFDQTPIEQVIETLKRLTGVSNMGLDRSHDWGGDAGDAYLVTQRITNMTAMSALKHILASKGLTYGFEYNSLVISTPEKIRPETIFHVYNVTDLLAKIRDFPAPEMMLKAAEDTNESGGVSLAPPLLEEEETLDENTLIELLKESVGGIEVWDTPAGNTIRHNSGQLFVTASPELHRKLVSVLESLRQDADLFVVIEARFIDVFDDFLEDIGIDTRALGLVNNLGTPFGNVINDNSTGGNDIGIVESGDPDDINLVQGLKRWAGRVQHIIDGFSGTIRGDRLTGGNGLSGGTFQATWLEPFQVNVILRMVQEKQDVRQLTAPVVTAHNNQRVYVSVITQRAYIADYELVSGGTGFSLIEVADPVVQTFQEGVILDVDPTISHDKKYVTLDVKPTLATLIGGIISTINISLGSFTNVAFQVPIGIPQIALQQSFTSVTVPNGGTVLLGGFRSMVDAEYESYLPILGEIPILKNLARRKATLVEKRSLVILLSARIVDLRSTEKSLFPTS